ncbi:MAG: hypothetical protein JWL73_2899 [Actinomycetia bacterium]|nr:hypothetical protein [Actinomycetes bacterium]
MDESELELGQARQQLGITFTDLWFRYFALGGTANVLEIEAYLRGVRPTALDLDILAVAPTNPRSLTDARPVLDSERTAIEVSGLSGPLRHCTPEKFEASVRRKPGRHPWREHDDRVERLMHEIGAFDAIP